MTFSAKAARRLLASVGAVLVGIAVAAHGTVPFNPVL
jgi:hypothetical protein